ncbi:MAG: PP2C family serine/threonine-protein phosphatase [Pirellulales bacterium]
MDEQSVNWASGLEHAAQSDVGLRRSNNQDALAVITAPNAETWARRGHLFMVADGMGAHAAGELASKMAVDTVPHTYYKLHEEPPATAIRKAIEDANARIHLRGQANLDFRGMGTTASVLVLLPEGAMVAHVGDSRVYRLRGNRMEQLSFDHSLVWEMMATGRIREEEVPSYIPKNIITRSLGPSPQVQVDLEGPFPLAAGDAFLLCSDGLSGQVSDEEIGVILGCLPPNEAVGVLVDLANLRGGPDNITVITVKVAAIPSARGASMLAAVPAGPRPTIHSAWWVALGVLVLVTLGLWAVQPWGAVVSGLAALATAIVVAVRKLGGSLPARPFEGPRFGRGPHKSLVCPANDEFVDKLAKVVDQLREAAAEENWSVDWPRFNSFGSRALAAAEKKNYREAVREYAHAISFMMDEIRSQRKKTPGHDIGWAG